MSKRKIAFVIGPYRSTNHPEWGDARYGVTLNIYAAEALAVELWRMGYIVICPHKNSEGLEGLIPDKGWLEGYRGLLECADIAVCVPGWTQSEGACAEVRHANALGRPVYQKLSEVPPERPWPVPAPRQPLDERFLTKRDEARDERGEARGEAARNRQPLDERFLAERDEARDERDEARGEAPCAAPDPAPPARTDVKRLTVREAARNRQPLGGADAQALEGALAQADRECDKLRAERDEALAAFHSQVDKHATVCGELAQCQRALAQVEHERDEARGEAARARANEIQLRAELDKAREERLLENEDLAHERDEAREERDTLRAQLAECQRLLAQGEKVDAITKEKTDFLERGVREAKVLLENVHMYLSSDDWRARSAWLKEFGSGAQGDALIAALEG